MLTVYPLLSPTVVVCSTYPQVPLAYHADLVLADFDVLGVMLRRAHLLLIVLSMPIRLAPKASVLADGRG